MWTQMKEMTHWNSQREGPLLQNSWGANPKIILPQLLRSDSQLLQRVKEQEAEFSGVKMAEKMTACKEKHQDRSEPRRAHITTTMVRREQYRTQLLHSRVWLDDGHIWGLPVTAAEMATPHQCSCH